MSSRTQARKAKDRRDRRARQRQYQERHTGAGCHPAEQPSSACPPRRQLPPLPRPLADAWPTITPCAIALPSPPEGDAASPAWMRLDAVPLYAFAFDDATPHDVNVAIAAVHRLGGKFLVVCDRPAKLYILVSTASLCGACGQPSCGADHREAAARVIRSAYDRLVSGRLLFGDLLVLPGWVGATGLNLKRRAREALDIAASAARRGG